MKYVLIFLSFTVSLQTVWGQNPNRSDMYLGYNSDAFVSPSLNIAHGFRLGYRFKLENNITFLQLNGSGSFGNGTGARIFMESPVYNFSQVVDADYEFAHMTFYFSVNQKLTGTTDMSGLYVLGGAGLMVNDILYTSRQNVNFYGTYVDVNMTEDRTYLSLSYHAGVGYDFCFDRFGIYIQADVTGSMGQYARMSMSGQGIYLYRFHPSFSLGIRFWFPSAIGQWFRF